MGEPQLQLELELEPVAEPIRGRVGRPGAPRRGFTGYAGLIAELQTIRDESRSAELLASDRGDGVT